MRKLVGVLFLLFIGGFLAVGVSVYFKLLHQPVNVSGQPVIFDVERGATLSSVAENLEQQGIIKSALAVRIYSKLAGHRLQVKVGEYSVSPALSAIENLETIASGKSVGRNLTVSEGLNVFEIADLYAAGKFGTREEFLKLAFDPQFATEVLGFPATSLEGYLFPETYSLTKFTTAKELIRNMVANYKQAYLEVTAGKNLNGWTEQQIVTLASIIEKETGATQERPLISSIFHNRLKKKMRLQTDPTIIYGKALKNGQMVIRISRADLTNPDPYNTYVIPALPPGPIANPSREAIAAAIEPATSEYLYFVSQNDGTHIFSKTYEDHAAAVRKFQMNPAARKGKSWRDLNKKTN